MSTFSKIYIHINGQIFGDLSILSIVLSESCDASADKFLITLQRHTSQKSFEILLKQNLPIQISIHLQNSSPFILFDGFISTLFFKKNTYTIVALDHFYLFRNIQVSFTLQEAYPLLFLKSYLQRLNISFYPTPSFEGRYFEDPFIFSETSLDSVIQFLSDYSNYYAFFLESRFLFIPKYYSLSFKEDSIDLDHPTVIDYEFESSSNILHIRKILDIRYRKAQRISVFSSSFYLHDAIQKQKYFIYKILYSSKENVLYQDLYLERK